MFINNSFISESDNTLPSVTAENSAPETSFAISSKDLSVNSYGVKSNGIFIISSNFTMWFLSNSFIAIILLNKTLQL